MSAEDRRLSDSVARSVMRITHGVKQWDETLTVSDSADFWLGNFGAISPTCTDHNPIF
jgi:hypothetical protein